MGKIEELEAALQRAREEADRANSALAAAKAALNLALAEKIGIAVGDIVSSKRGVFRVGQIDVWGRDLAWLRGFKQLKGGEFSGRMTCIGSEWEKIEPKQ